MKIYIVSVGSIKEKYLKDAIQEYAKRITKYSSIEFLNIADEPIPLNASLKDEEIVKNKEGEKLLKIIPSKSYKVVLDLKGNELNSIELSNKIKDIFTYENDKISFIIGGSLGLSNNVLDIADYRLCFSKMTFPHQLMQVILLEQLYRGFKIIHNEKYHK